MAENLHDKYSTARSMEEAVERVLEADVSAGIVLRFTEEEARRRFDPEGGVIIAALGALEKGVGPSGELVARVLHDGTNGVFLVHGTRMRDKVSFPTAADLKAVFAEIYDEWVLALHVGL